MRALIQRVTYGMVSVGSKKIGEIGKGLVVLVGIKRGDTEARARELAQKVLRLRLFSEWPAFAEASAGKERPMKKTILEEKGEMFVIPEITLYANTKGGRIDFSDAEAQEKAKKLFEFFVEELRKSGLKIETGIFGEHMLVEIYNDGPVTILEEL